MTLCVKTKYDCPVCIDYTEIYKAEAKSEESLSNERASSKHYCILFKSTRIYDLSGSYGCPRSGKEAALLRLPPLETGRAPLNAPSLSASRTTRLLFLSSL